MVGVTYVNHCKPRYIGAAEETNFMSVSYSEYNRCGQRDKEYSYQVR